MTGRELLDAVGKIDGSLVEEAVALQTGDARKRKVAACLAAAAVLVVLVAAGVLTSGKWMSRKPPVAVRPTADSEGRLLWVDDRERGGIEPYRREVAIVWPWEVQTITEQYRTLVWNGQEYIGGRQVEIREELLGASLGAGDARGYDEYNEKEYVLECEVREISGILPQLSVAVQLEDSYYVFDNSEYDPPQILGEFLEGYSLPETLPLTLFTHYDKDRESKGRYALSKECSDQIWTWIGECGATPFYEWQTGDYETLYAGGYLGFQASSEALGLQNLAFYVTSTGYLWTNICGWAYSFNIGEEVAGEIIAYALEHARQAAQEPKYYLTGEVTEIGENYFKLDDTLMMKHPEEGKEFTILTEDIRILRYFAQGEVREGDMVSVEYDGLIYAEEPEVVRGPLSMSKVFVDRNGQILIPE